MTNEEIHGTHLVTAQATDEQTNGQTDRQTDGHRHCVTRPCGGGLIRRYCIVIRLPDYDCTVFNDQSLRLMYFRLHINDVNVFK